jgi:hypothetical protein
MTTLLQERQRLISMYITQYNQTNDHITRLFDTLDDIRNNINTLIGNNIHNIHNTNMNTNTNTNMNTNTNTNMNNNRVNRYNRPNRQNRQTNLSIPRRHVYYDYSNPIDRSTYVTDFMSDVINNNTSNIQQHENNQHITDFLTTFLSTSVPVRPTQDQINIASRLVRFGDIQAPNSATCAISLETFDSEDNVRQLNHCGHIFFPGQFNQWFQNNVRCPVCRHDIRSMPAAEPMTVSGVDTLDLSGNEISENQFLTNFITGLFMPNSRPSNISQENQLYYDTIMRVINNPP